MPAFKLTAKTQWEPVFTCRTGQNNRGYLINEMSFCNAHGAISEGTRNLQTKRQIFCLISGSTSGGTETLAFQIEKYYRIGPCLSGTSCAAFSLDSLEWYLHGDHEYYVSVRAQNGAGLSAIGISSVYRHIIQLPSMGVVLDVAPPGELNIRHLGVR